jgi:hypothetical protein
MTEQSTSIPSTGGVRVKHWTQEPTLRDQFAMAALTGLIFKYGTLHPSLVAEKIYVFADAMMEARK